MRFLSLLSFLALYCAISCTPKVQEVVPDPAPVVEVKVPETPDNPCGTLQDLSGAAKEETENAYVLYRDNIKLQDWDEAFRLWKKAYYGAPAANGRIKYQFEDGIKIYKHFYDNETDPGLKREYMDSIMAIYDKRVECYGERYYVTGRKAFDYYYSFYSQIELDSIYEMFKVAVDGKKQRADYFVINPFTKILSDKIVAGDIDMDEGRYFAGLLLDAIAYGNASGKNKEAWAIINEYAPPRLENLEGIKGFYDCQYYKDKYYALYQADPENCEIINRAYSRMLWGDCDKEDAIVLEIFEIKEEKCYTPPPPPGTLRQAYNAYTEGKYNESIDLFEEFIEKTEDEEKKFKYNLLIAKIYYADIRNFVKSRQYAMKASEHKPESGEPYLLIGKLYASSGPICGPGTGWDSQIVTWPAIDMFEVAAKDPLVADEAKKWIRTYWQYMPKREDIFQRTIKAGSSFKVGCWINRTTTVRTAD